MWDWEEQKRLVTIDSSVDFGLIKPADVHKRELLVKTQKCKFTSRNKALWMTTISKQMARKIFQTCFPTLFEVLQIGEYTEVLYLLYNQAQPPPNVPKNTVWMILQDFEWFPKGFDKKYDCYRPIMQIDCTFANWYFISCFHTIWNST